MKLAVPLNYAASFKDGAEQAVAFERAGADIVWVAEAYGFDAPRPRMARPLDRASIPAAVWASSAGVRE